MGDIDITSVDDDMAADNKVELEPVREGTPSSIESTPEQEIEGGGEGEPSQELAQPQKRKGGRKPIYATSEERKQRNRQAQAAFRERRTEYIKQLEATIKQNEETLASLQQSHRSAADECLMLRYKNSLLERILLEKGIDVQAELQMKTGSPTFGFEHPAANIPQIHPPQPPLQRATIQRQHARRSGQNFAPKLTPSQSSAEMGFQTSPQGHPTPSSHPSSPTSLSTRSPMVMQQGGNTPPTSAILAQPQAQQYHPFSRAPSQQQQQQPSNSSFYPNQPQMTPLAQRPQPPQQRPAPPSNYQSSVSVVSSHSTGSRQSLNPPPSAGASGGGGGTAGPPPSQYYPSPFQKHIDQLEQEYDTQHTHSMLDEPDADADGSDPAPQLHGNFPSQFEQERQRQQQQRHAMPSANEYYPHVPPGQHQMTQQQMQQIQGATSHPQSIDSHQFDGQMIDPNDPMLDADPFGLSASMHYPTSYSFEHAPHR